MSSKRLTTVQQSRHKDIAAHESVAFLRLIETVKKYEYAKRLYIFEGDDDAYSTMRAARTEIRGYVNRLADAG